MNFNRKRKQMLLLELKKPEMTITNKSWKKWLNVITLLPSLALSLIVTKKLLWMHKTQYLIVIKLLLASIIHKIAAFHLKEPILFLLDPTFLIKETMQMAITQMLLEDKKS